MTAPDTPTRGPGRPRDATIDVEVLAATCELLAERGFDGVTVQAIAARSGVHASAIYRRWPSRTEIIEQAVFPGLTELSVATTGDLMRDLRRYIRAYHAILSEPAARAAIPGLLASYQSAGRAPAEQNWLAVSARPQFYDILAVAGTVADIDPDDVFDLLIGALLARVLVPTVAARNRPLERLVEMVHRLLAPAGTAQP